MKSLLIFLIFYNCFTIFSWNPVSATNAWDFNFNFSGFTNQAKLVITDCNAVKLEQEINRVLGGIKHKGVIQQPHNIANLSHVTCVDDPFMGKAINLTLFKMDDVPKHGHMQRLELKSASKSKSLVAHRDEEIIYSWWFYVDPSLTVEKQTFTIFSLKTGSLDSHNHSLASFSLSKKQGLNLRFDLDAKRQQTTKISMLLLSAVRGAWIQAFVQVQYKKATGFINVILKDILGHQLFPAANQTGIFHGDTFHSEWTSVRPKWGLSRTVSQDYHNSVYLLLQNLQVWKKM
ncbi:hypothetical protein DAPPUDRAFT_329543 [Daphnia pulex]|uniref:Uncharacterized protein n=1 Tax=Daphnia pulex TaxID=6669 RepID=E9HGX1_DAPPU|nr:hypothetical protein DAPPUDRAFT_329543 [Daphnia pulex]|eukprot:EFX69033.1 hypothetical protein DAPPUDRAFT_329543 [Daphnia pulex]